jgi:hypothetical protein
MQHCTFDTSSSLAGSLEAAAAVVSPGLLLCFRLCCLFALKCGVQLVYVTTMPTAQRKGCKQGWHCLL